MRLCLHWLLVVLFLTAACATTSNRSGSDKKRGRTGSSEKVARASASDSSSGKKAGKKHRKASRKEGSSDVPETYSPRKTKCEEYLPTIKKYARQYDLEPELVMGVIKVESSFNPGLESRVGATGLMQIMPRTGEHMQCGDDLEDPETNIECGCRVLKRYVDRYNGNLVYGLSAYNTGPGNTNKYSTEWHLPFNFAYVEKVLRWRNVFVRFGCR